MQIPLENGVVAWFLDPNDAAVSKLVRGAENDIRWTGAALESGMVQQSVVLARLPTSSASCEEANTARAALQLITGTPKPERPQ